MPTRTHSRVQRNLATTQATAATISAALQSAEEDVLMVNHRSMVCFHPCSTHPPIDT